MMSIYQVSQSQTDIRCFQWVIYKEATWEIKKFLFLGQVISGGKSIETKVPLERISYYILIE